MDTSIAISLSAACVSISVGFIKEDTLEATILVLSTLLGTPAVADLVLDRLQLFNRS
jgi:hypothetical protein